MVNKSLLVFVSGLILFSNLSIGKVIAAPAGTGWQMTFEDNFDGPNIDTSKWNKRYPYGDVQINGEYQAYFDKAFSFNNGILRIKADKANPPIQYGDYLAEYSSGILATHNLFSQKYGYFEVSAKLPKGQALWPAFWLAGPTINEIDIFEFINDSSNSIYMGNHWGTSWATDHFENSYNYRAVNPVVDFTSGFHTYAVDWDVSRIVWYVDGVEKFRSSGGVPQIPMAVRLNLAVGGDWPGVPNPNGAYPYYLDVDYVRVYQKSGLITPITTPTGVAKSGDANLDGKVDGLDYVVWLMHYNMTTAGGSKMGDFNSSGLVDGLDYVIWLNNYGK